MSFDSDNASWGLHYQPLVTKYTEVVSSQLLAAITCAMAMCFYYTNISLYYIAVQIGFKQDSYTVLESDGSVTVCVNSTTRSFNVPVTLETLDIGTAQGMYSYCSVYQ